MTVWDQYGTMILYGIIVNLVSTFGFGLYKAANLSEEEMVSLVERYEPRDDYGRLIASWMIPYFGFLYVFREVWRLQGFLNRGLGIYDYLEHTLKNR